MVICDAMPFPVVFLIMSRKFLFDLHPSSVSVCRSAELYLSADSIKSTFEQKVNNVPSLRRRRSSGHGCD